MEPQEKPSMQFEENQAQKPSSEQLELISKWVAVFSEHHHREISELGMATYIEGLKDLTVQEIANGCEKAFKEVDRMPTVAHIRARAGSDYAELAMRLKADEMYEKTLGWVRINYSADLQGKIGSN